MQPSRCFFAGEQPGDNGRGKYVVQNLESYEKTQATIKLLAELSKGLESIRAEGTLSIDEAFAGLEE